MMTWQQACLASARHLGKALALTALLAGTAASPAEKGRLPTPVAYYSFDDIAAERQIHDAGGHGYHGTVLRSKRLTGPFVTQLQQGIRGNALTCGGSQQYGPFMSIPEPPQLHGPFTIMFWLKPGGGQWITRVIYYKPGWLSRDGFEVQLSSTTLALVLCPPDARKETRHWVRADRPVQVKCWAFLAVRWNGKAWDLFLNGRHTAREDSSDFAYRPPAKTVPLNIGGYSVQTNNIFCGSIDEARLFNTALTEAQIRAIMMDDIERD